jgi:formylmethanofuran dehydrogenase subunit E
MYAKTIQLNIFDVQEDRCLYDFLNALRTVDVTFVVDRKTILNYEVQQEKLSSFILNFLKKFRNHLRIVKTLFNQIDYINKRINHSTFAISQNQSTKSNEKSDHKCSDNCDHSENSENFESKFILIVIESNEKKYSNCLCEMCHRYIKRFNIRFNIKKSD